MIPLACLWDSIVPMQLSRVIKSCLDIQTAFQVLWTLYKKPPGCLRGNLGVDEFLPRYMLDYVQHQLSSYKRLPQSIFGAS